MRLKFLIILSLFFAAPAHAQTVESWTCAIPGMTAPERWESDGKIISGYTDAGMMQLSYGPGLTIITNTPEWLIAVTDGPRQFPRMGLIILDKRAMTLRRGAIDLNTGVTLPPSNDDFHLLRTCTLNK